MTDKIVVLTTCDSEKRALALARHLVEQRVAACVNILPKARSVYRWNNRIENTAEWLVVIKSRRDRYAALHAQIEKVHTYEVPEIVALQVVDGSEAYLDWIDRELTRPES